MHRTEASSKVFLSLVVTSYGREEPVKRLIESCQREFTELEYEIVVVSSDPIDSPKLAWLRAQPKVNSVEVGDRPHGAARARSLYFYENLGISEAMGEFILVTNDDTTIEPGTQAAFLDQCVSADVVVFPTEIDDATHGKRAPVIGEVQQNSDVRPIFLLDFAAIRREIYKEIGPMDEGLDWYGGGVDRGVKCALLPTVRHTVLSAGGLKHSLELENRTPPHANFDLRYISTKWQTYVEEQSDVGISFYEPHVESRIPDWMLRKVWPKVSRLWLDARSRLNQRK